MWTGEREENIFSDEDFRHQQSSECDWKPIEECKSLLTAYLDSKVSIHGTIVMSQ